eukprot:2274616-Amphidinium_carterae.1
MLVLGGRWVIILRLFICSESVPDAHIDAKVSALQHSCDSRPSATLMRFKAFRHSKLTGVGVGNHHALTWVELHARCFQNALEGLVGVSEDMGTPFA